MQQIDASIRGLTLDFDTAAKIAHSIASALEREPTVVAWHDGPQRRMSPVIEGADVESRWRDYGEAYHSDLAVSINGDFDFMFADTSGFEKLEDGPYLSVHDPEGHEYLCLPWDLRDPTHPDTRACVKLDEPEHSHLHEG